MAGLKTELEEFVDKYQHRFVRHAFFRIGNVEDAEDIIQDVLIKMISNQGFANSVISPMAYAFRMIANACTDRHRKAERHMNISLERISDKESFLIESSESELIRQEEYERINKLLDSIPAEQSETVRYRIVDGLSFPEIAEILGLPLTTVKSRFKYGLDKIKNQFFQQKEVPHEL